MSKTTDQDYLVNDQYRDSSKLDARIALHARFGNDNWHQWVFDHFDLPDAARVLEVGCGPGVLWLKNLDRLPASWSIVLSDLSNGMLHQARKYLGDHSNFTFEQFDAQDIPYPNETFDAVIANHMLYHVPDRPKAYREVMRVLKPDGRLFAATNAKDNMRQLADLGRAVGIETVLRTFTPTTDFFTIENAEVELKRCFGDVSLHRQNETLVVTVSQPLMDYILSGANSGEITYSQRNLLQATIEAEIAATGAFRIDRKSGLFVATK
jgi:ubiquinone/menaquinone biosynthesis C-methylase UbiE